MSALEQSSILHRMRYLLLKGQLLDQSNRLLIRNAPIARATAPRTRVLWRRPLFRLGSGYGVRVGRKTSRDTSHLDTIVACQQMFDPIPLYESLYRRAVLSYLCKDLESASEENDR